MLRKRETRPSDVHELVCLAEPRFDFDVIRNGYYAGVCLIERRQRGGKNSKETQNPNTGPTNILSIKTIRLIEIYTSYLS
jgi:hypothetical protein